jgi:hypothetical protein
MQRSSAVSFALFAKDVSIDRASVWRHAMFVIEFPLSRELLHLLPPWNRQLRGSRFDIGPILLSAAR